MNERALLIECGGESMVAVMHDPAEPAPVGVVVVVGGPQYRVGSHRQFVLLARGLAAAGYATLRFDYRGMGDTAGEPRGFENVNDDIHAAIDRLMKERPEVRRVVLWGLCDGASASLMYAPTDSRVAGIVMLNPWARTEAGIAQAYVKHYYSRRLLDAEFWKSLVTFKVNVGAALLDFARKLVRAAGSSGATQGAPYTERMARAIESYPGAVLLILSGRDLTAREFESHCARSAVWTRALSRATCEQQRLAEADHTFSTREWRDAVTNWTRVWLQTRISAGGGWLRK